MPWQQKKARTRSDTIPQIGTDNRKETVVGDLSDFTKAIYSKLSSDIIPEIQRVTIPIYGLQDGQVKLCRTGVLYRVAGYHFILTASHELRRTVEAGIPLCVLPNEDDPEGPIVPLIAKFHTTEEDGRDVAAVRLTDEVAKQIAPYKSFIQNDRIASFGRPPNGLHYFFGYPQELFGRASAGTIRSNPLGVLCTEYVGDKINIDDYLPKVHVLLEFEREGISLKDSSELQPPKPHGISGCGIWRICDFTREGVEKCGADDLRLVALEHSWSPGRYVRGTRIEYALQLIVEKYPELKRSMNIAYPPP